MSNMTNEEKQRISAIEARLLRAEAMLQNIVIAIQDASRITHACSRCGANEPVKTGYVCCEINCPHGCNPADDE